MRTVGVKDARYANGEPVLAIVVVDERLGAALAFIVAGARSAHIDEAAIVLGLRMHVGIAVDLTGRGLEDPGAQALGEPQHIYSAEHARFRRLHGIVLIVDGRGRAGKIVDLVHFHVERKGYVVAHDLKAKMARKPGDVLTPACKVVVDAEHLAILAQQPLAQVRSDEPGAAGNKNTLSHGVSLLLHWRKPVSFLPPGGVGVPPRRIHSTWPNDDLHRCSESSIRDLTSDDREGEPKGALEVFSRSIGSFGGLSPCH